MATGSVVGIVSNATTGMPIANVQVKASIKGTGAAAPGPKTQTLTSANGGYSLELESMLAGYGWIYLITFTKTGYRTATGEVSPLGPASIKTLNMQMSPLPPTCPTGQHWDSAQGKCVSDLPPPCPSGQHWDSSLGYCVSDALSSASQYELRVHFITLPGATETRAQTILGTMTALANGAITYPPPYGQVGGYAALGSGLNWSGKYYWFRYRKLGTPGLPLGIIALIFFTVLLSVSLIYSGWIEWCQLQEHKVVVQEKVVETKTDLAGIASQMFNEGKITTEQYLAILKAISDSTTIPDVPDGDGWTWPTLTNLEPIIILVIIIAAAAIGVSFLRR